MCDPVDLLSAEVIRCGIQSTPVAGKFYLLEYLDGTMHGPWFYAPLDENRMCPDGCLSIPDDLSPCKASPGMSCRNGYFIDAPASLDSIGYWQTKLGESDMITIDQLKTIITRYGQNLHIREPRGLGNPDNKSFTVT